MALGRVVPWADWEEWEGVRTGISSDDLRLRRAALERVGAWEVRGKLPLGAEITACLLELHMRDHGLSSIPGTATQPGSEPESLLRLQYAMLVIRLVNGISDSSQKGRVAMSVANLAEDAGIPRILVDVRHDASHNELPSLALLRLASTAALSWLSLAYWHRQADHLQSCRAHISSLLQKYIELQRAAILKQATTGKAEGEDSADVAAATDAQAAYSGALGQKQRKEVIAEMWERVHAAADLLVGPLLDNGLLNAHEDASGVAAEGSKSKLNLEQVAAAVWEAVVQGLSSTWPQLRQLLLAAAVQRLCSPSPSDAASSHDPPPRGSQSAGDTEGNGAISKFDIIAQWVDWLLGTPREDGQKRSKQQKVGAKRKSSQADSDNGRQRGQWKPSSAQLKSLLSGCLHALAERVSMQDGPLAQNRAAALRRVALMLLEKQKDLPEGLSQGSAQQSQQLQCLVNMTTGDAGGAVAAAAGDETPGMQELSEALIAAQAAQEELVRRATDATPTSGSKSAKKPRWCLAEDWAPCALGMLPSPHHPCGCMPTLDAAASQSGDCPVVLPSSSGVPEEHIANALPELGIVEDIADVLFAQGEQGREPAEDVEVPDYFSRFETPRSHAMEEPAAGADTRLSKGHIQGIAAGIKIL